MKFIRYQENLRDKKILLRLDLNVPIKNGIIKDETRINKILPIIDFLLKKKSKILIISHIGRPNGKKEESLSLKPICENLKTKLRSRGLFEYSFSHFDLETEIFYCNVRKSQILNASWIKKSNYSKSGLPTIMKKIVKIAI